ncbi:hypothetical protein MGG_04468 [Pyricularia oryzae 70-15]|uniref:Uncharacterized protein n=1 Tax=Pyricularia oryzae (strain 70-15 / ATCC MYA-4617 / FGSC 8958) TaxID=242507 RepID=G4MKJ8_PYRO7|nr:uncharacterized protein MGG_04468 [Pyricularia oryzae 70-15]EHA58381.1 hypothetical protein MGG_04468 [Pyricularia oryzae 70-15]
MHLPFQRILVCGEVLFCAQGGTIHAFNIKDHSYLGKWDHPDSAKEAEAQKELAEQKATKEVHEDSHDAEESVEDGPPSKRVKLDPRSSTLTDTAATGSPASGNGTGAESTNGEGKGRPKKGSRMAAPIPSDLPWVAILVATSDSRHLVAVSGHDKTIWTFSHDGAGKLTELSKRSMPKRPCAVAITADNQTIISGDKFGDVFALPLIESDTPIAVTTLVSRSEKRKASFKPEADETTVHSMRNLRALANQKLHLEQHKKKPAEAEDADASGPAFDHALLLGHVSMLTALALSSRPSPSDPNAIRPYIITGDRDEHIRVSRGIPQSHVIENFCLGHENFVSDLCIPTVQPERLLISGGGDSDLFLWDWPSGKVLDRQNLLQHVQSYDAAAATLAVSKIVSFDKIQGEMQTHHMVAVICERVPAIFLYEINESGSLSHKQTVFLPSNPLDAGSNDGDLIIALDTTSPTSRISSEYGDIMGAKSCLVYLGEDGQWMVRLFSVQPNRNLIRDMTREDLHRALYPIESLRKAPIEEREEEPETAEKTN